MGSEAAGAAAARVSEAGAVEVGTAGKAGTAEHKQGQRKQRQ